jgi:hypothetical protein
MPTFLNTMKKTTLGLVFLFLLCHIFNTENLNAQTTPPGIPYQAIARNANGTPYVNAALSVRFSLHEQTATGTVSYAESHSLQTNDLGLFSTTFGSGTPITGNFSAINWAQTTKFLQVEINLGSAWVDLGAQQMMSVPFALYSGSNGKNSLVKTTNEPAGATCTTGGVKMEYGIDANNNGILDLGEINNTLTKFVCNGISTMSNPISNIHGNQIFNGAGIFSFAVPNGVFELEISLYGASGGKGGNILDNNFYTYYSGGNGGEGNFSKISFVVSPNDIIQITNGTNGSNAPNTFATNPYVCCYSASAGTNGTSSSVLLNGVTIFEISGGAGGIGGNYYGVNSGINGAQGATGIINLTLPLNNGINITKENIFNVPPNSALIRY